MALTLKIALGVFLGIMAAYALIETPSWMAHSKRAHAENVMAALTPDTLIARCGKPLKDETEEDGMHREIGYQGTAINGHQRIALLDFGSLHGKSWFLASFHLGIDSGVHDPTVQEKDPEEQLNILPCVDK